MCPCAGDHPASYARFVAPILAALPSGTFSAVVTGDQVTMGSRIEPYLKAAESLAADPADCIAIEDSILAPHRPKPPVAPCWSCPITSAVPEGPRRVFVDDLVGLRLEGPGQTASFGQCENLPLDRVACVNIVDNSSRSAAEGTHGRPGRHR